MDKILVIGCSGQIGSELTLELRKIYGDSKVIATDIRPAPPDVAGSGPFEILDVLDASKLQLILEHEKVTQIYHLAAILSGNAEKRPLPSWDINMRSLMNVLELARELKIRKIFWPSSIAVFGPTTPRFDTPQFTIMEPNTVYGISKLAGERWIEYYFNKYGVDTRSLRYPGLISYKTEAGGGTTDYAVEIFYEAIRHKKYDCFLGPDSALPMMFMPDAIKATIDVMEADSAKLSLRSSYNVAGISFTPAVLAGEIKKHIPEFEITYTPDFRQAIADSWPARIDDSVAKKDWGLNYQYDLSKMTTVMLNEISNKLRS
ncbi:MAG: NAD-dependent epimerase/dehydratase family protein [Bacteroidales bacterium]|nr:NAD-dependent epimerase/dehydratase family protein [Bacteroidales bacterium]HNW72084.1 NAD-dependent epimerase/dehydratase family protein [Bacteroidales bacterium]HPS49125.1 NAD-dependent epimerase/dehydratase family protein [Bacteroidales bacterium]